MSDIRPRGRGRYASEGARPDAQRILAGFHAVGARLRNDPGSVTVLYFDASRRDARMQQLLALAADRQVRCVAADAVRLQGLCPDAPHQGVVAQTSGAAPEARFEDLLDAVNAETFLLLLDGVTDPRNLGACMRTAAAAGVQAVIVPRDRAASVTAVTAKAAAGATESLPLVAVTNLARAMKDMQDAGIWIVGAEGDAPRSLYEVDLTAVSYTHLTLPTKRIV